VASLSQGRTAAAQCGLFTHKSVPVIFEPPCTCSVVYMVWAHIIKVKVKQCRNRPGVAQRVPGGLGSQIFMTFGTWW